jgi:hypothetical protein
MKKRTVLLIGAATVLAFACQKKDAEPMPAPPPQTQTMPCSDPDECSNEAKADVQKEQPAETTQSAPAVEKPVESSAAPTVEPIKAPAPVLVEVTPAKAPEATASASAPAIPGQN